MNQRRSAARWRVPHVTPDTGHRPGSSLAPDNGHTSARPALSDTAISPVALAAAGFRQVAVHADEEYIEAFEQPHQVLPPSTELDDVLDDQVVSAAASAGRHL